MEHYVTLFDGLFLPQGLALHASMERHAGEYTLWILCLDDEARDALASLNLRNVRLLDLSLLETEGLKAVRPTRSRREYCWTLTPFAPDFVFSACTEAARVTYVDADLWFRGRPSAIFGELESAGKAVLITEHAYAAELDQSAISGIYCVQFITFCRSGQDVLRWWQERCLEWCYARHEDGKFGDQKYLDDWPARYPDKVHVLQKKELILAPWNATRFPFSGSILYHFHELRIISERKISVGSYRLPKTLVRGIYFEYAKDLQHAIRRLGQSGRRLRPQTGAMDRLKNLLIKLLRSRAWFRGSSISWQ